MYINPYVGQTSMSQPSGLPPPTLSSLICKPYSLLIIQNVEPSIMQPPFSQYVRFYISPFIMAPSVVCNVARNIEFTFFAEPPQQRDYGVWDRLVLNLPTLPYSRASTGEKAYC